MKRTSAPCRAPSWQGLASDALRAFRSCTLRAGDSDTSKIDTSPIHVSSHGQLAMGIQYPPLDFRASACGVGGCLLNEERCTYH